MQEQEEFEIRVKAIEKRLFLAALSILRHPQDAEDAVQEGILKAYRKRKSLRDEDRFEAWITRIVICESYHLNSKRKKGWEMTENIWDTCFTEVERQDVEFFDTISALSREEQSVLILRFYFDYSLEDISRCLRLPLSTAKSRLYRALAKLKARMEGVE